MRAPSIKPRVHASVAFSKPSEARAGLAPPGRFALLAVATLTIMVGCAIVPGLPRIATALRVGDGASWLVTLPALGVVLAGPFAGRLIDRLGARRALLYGLMAYGVLGCAGALARGVEFVFADRLMLGAATAVVMASGTTLISELYRGTERSRMIAHQGMAIELGGVVFLFVGGLLAGLGWAAPFLLYAMAFVFALAVVFFIPKVRLHAVGQDPDDTDATHSSLFVPYVSALASMLTFFVAIVVLPYRLANFPAHSFDASETGATLAFISLVAVAAAAMMPRVVDKVGELYALAWAFGLYALAHVNLALGSSLFSLAAGAIALGCGFGLSVPLVNLMTVERSPGRVRGRNLARLSMALFLGQFLAGFWRAS